MQAVLDQVSLLREVNVTKPWSAFDFRLEWAPHLLMWPHRLKHHVNTFIEPPFICGRGWQFVVFTKHSTPEECSQVRHWMQVALDQLYEAIFFVKFLAR